VHGNCWVVRSTQYRLADRNILVHCGNAETFEATTLTTSTTEFTAWSMDVDSNKVGVFSTADCTAEVEGLTSSAPAPAACAGIAATRDIKAAGTAGAEAAPPETTTNNSVVGQIVLLILRMALALCK